MADVITWRSMAGPNFSGTAAAMDAGAERISQLGTAFNQFAADQTQRYAGTKAKLRADNTARALSQLSSINDLNQLNQQMPNFSYIFSKRSHVCSIYFFNKLNISSILFILYLFFLILF